MRIAAHKMIPPTKEAVSNRLAPHVTAFSVGFTVEPAVVAFVDVGIGTVADVVVTETTRKIQ